MSSTTVDDHDRKRKSIKDIFGGRGIIVPLYPLLAEQIGAGDALLLVQIEYWIDHLRVKVEEFEGMKWLNLSAQEMIERGFRHLDRRNINRTITRLVDRGLLRMAHLPGSHVKWLTLDYEMIEGLDPKVTSVELSEPSQGETPQAQQTRQDRGKMPQGEANRPRQEGQNAPFSEAICPKPPLYIKDLKDHEMPNTERENNATLPQDDELAVEQLTASPQKPEILNTENKIAEESHAESIAPEPPRPTDQSPDEKILEDMMDALENACLMDRNLSWHAKQIEIYAKMLLTAGYTSYDVDQHSDWWYTRDWRGKKGEVPRLKELADTLHLSRPAVHCGFQGIARIPSNKNAVKLHLRADPTCEHCHGDGWFESVDPRLPWSVCDCVKRHGVVLST